VRTYGQYCPIARASEILAERWTPLVLRNMLLGAVTFTEIALAEWHLGRIEWVEALRSEWIAVVGPPSLARSLPTWNRRSEAAQARRSSLTSKR
jgi:hypothetical protein